ncbi:hypothetical protein WA158_003993 [Blastocystis sp. Blastoise]
MTKYGFVSSIPATEGNYDVTLITQTSTLRLFYFPYLLSRWSGPMVAAIFLKKADEEEFKEFINAVSLSQRLHLVRYRPVDESIYPYNKLRNIAVARVTTSHFWVADMDMWPAENVYETLRSLPEQVLSNDFMAVIVPAFEYKKLPNCDDFVPCVKKVIPHVPRNRHELTGCISQQMCQPFRPGAWVHDYLTEDWYREDYHNPLLMVPCFKSVKQEPYVMVKRSVYLPPFDERFINYGKDKISWIEHLRYSGYLFGVLKDAFAIDIPHPRSELAKVFYNKLFTEGGMSIDMNILWLDFVKELHEKYPDRSVTYLCDKLGKDY